MKFGNGSCTTYLSGGPPALGVLRPDVPACKSFRTHPTTYHLPPITYHLPHTHYPLCQSSLSLSLSHTPCPIIIIIINNNMVYTIWKTFYLKTYLSSYVIRDLYLLGVCEAINQCASCLSPVVRVLIQKASRIYSCYISRAPI